jgi:imidazolonepropionase-like amidohydrolase
VESSAVPGRRGHRPAARSGGAGQAGQVRAGTERAYALARECGVRLAWGTDILFDPCLAGRQGKQLAKMARWFTPAEVLTMATSTNAELLALAGPRNPYPSRALGRVEPGAWADLLLVDGNPLGELALLADPDRNLAVIMKDGVIHKNGLIGAHG